MPSLSIRKILETKKITEYLAKKGIHPESEHGGKIKYLCPIHQEKTPSFYVYTNSEYENFYCFGCKATYNIIHLYQYLERVSLGEAIRALADGLDIDINAELSAAVAEIETDIATNMQYSLPDLSLMINRQLYDFLKMVENDESCTAQVEKMAKIIDRALDQGDVESLKVINESITDALTKRYKMYLDEQETKLRSQLQ